MTKEIQSLQEEELLPVNWDDIINSIDTEELSQKDVEALSYMLVGYSIPESANMASMTPDTWRRHIKDSKVIQSALTEKKKLMMALMLNKFQKQMMRAMEVSNQFLLEDPEDIDLDKSQTSIYLKKVTHAEWVINTFMKIMSSNPLEGLSIINEGDGDVHMVLNVDGVGALDYLANGMKGNKKLILDAPKAEPVSNVPLLDERGLPPFGIFGGWAYDEQGGIICHTCGSSFKSKQALIGHIGTHNINTDTYSEVYNVIWDEIV